LRRYTVEKKTKGTKKQSKGTLKKRGGGKGGKRLKLPPLKRKSK